MKRKLLLLVTLVATLSFSSFANAQDADLEFNQLAVDTSNPHEGTNIKFTFKVKNLGPYTATNITVEDILPAGYTFVSIDTGTGYNSGTSVWTIPSISVGATMQLKIIAYPNAGTSGTTIVSKPFISGLDQTDAFPANDSACLDVNVRGIDLEITKKSDINIGNEGDIVVYTLKAKHKNTTNLDATNVLVEDILPTSLTYISDTSGSIGTTFNTTTGIWDVGTLIPNEQKEITITAQINGNTSGKSINNVARLYSFDQNDSNSDNDIDNAEIEVLSADIKITKGVNDTTPSEGDTLTFTLKAKNDGGPGNATNVIVQDLLPAGLTYVSDSSLGVDYNSVTGNWTIGDILPGVTKTLTIDALVNLSTAGTKITNTATYTFDQYDDNSTNNEDSVDIFVNGADLSITKTVSEFNPAVDDIISYNIRVDNFGPLQATGVVIEDIIPTPELLYQSNNVIIGGGTYSSATGLWTIGSINSGAYAEIEIFVKVQAAADKKLTTNTASVFSVNEDDSVTANNSDIADIAVGRADLKTTKTVSAGPYSPGDNITYTIALQNKSNNTHAYKTQLVDILPEGVTYVSDDSATTLTTYDATTGIWDLGTLNKGTTMFLNIVGSIDSGTGASTIINSATASSSVFDNNLSNNTDTASIQVNGSDLAVAISVNNQFPSEEQDITYVVTVTNNGPLDATGIQLLNEIPFSTDWISTLESQGTYSYISGVWNVGSLINGASATLTIVTKVRLSGAFPNTATITAADQSDAVTANNTATAAVSAQKTFGVGSAIIDMGVSIQTYNNGLIPYGLVYDLAINNLIPIYWVVNHTKTWVDPNAKQDQVDLTVNGKDYKAGPFVIPAEYMDVAEPIIDQWVLDYPGLLVDKSLPEFESGYYDYISSFPRAVLDDQNGDKVQDAFYEKANVPITFGRLGGPDDLTLCDDMYTMPHADPQDWSAGTVNKLIDFIENGGYFWAACHAVSAMEALVDTDGDGKPDLNLLSNNGLVEWNDHEDGTPPYSYNTQVGIFNGAETAGDPLMQFMGTMDGALQSGSEQIYLPLIEGWRDSTILAVTDEDHPDVIDGTHPTGPAAALAYGRAFGVQTNGMVMYEGSHKISGGTVPEDVAAARVYGNFLLQAGIERRPDIKVDRINYIVAAGYPTVITADVSGIAPPFTFQWIDSCGGTFTNETTASPTYTPNPAIIGPDKCFVRVLVTDNCGRRNFSSFPVFVEVDTDNDGLVNSIDLDDDNDAILDTVENNGDTERDTDNDGVFDRLDYDSDNDGIYDIVESGLSAIQISTFDTDNDGSIDDTFSFGPNGLIDDLETGLESGKPDYDGNGIEDTPTNSDGDAFYDFQDIDADNDGIPDNVELQTTAGYVAPAVISDKKGRNIAYAFGMTLTDTDGDGTPDYIDTDADNDGTPDIEENGMADALLNVDLDSDGLDNAFEGAILNDLDSNDEIDNPSSSVLPDTDGDLATGGDLDYRDTFSVTIPTFATIDFDGVDDYVSSDLDMSGYTQATAMAWVKLDPAFTNRGYVLSFGGLKLEVDDFRKAKFRVNHVYADFPDNIILDKDKWYHMALVFNSGLGSDNLKAYVNGKLIGSSSAEGLKYAVTNETVEFNIGKRSYDSDRYFKGCIDEVRVFNIALSQNQMKKIIHQEIQEISGSVSGLIIPKTIIDKDSDLTIPWANLKAYYPMTNITSGSTADFSGNNHVGILNNITTIQAQTAPMPFKTSAAGDINNPNTWLYGDVWDMDALSDTENAIIQIDHDVTINKPFKTLGLVVSNGKTLTVNGDNLVSNSWYLELNGTLDLMDDSQLVQGVQSDLVTSIDGKLLRRQEGTSSPYRYNYWSSPIGITSVSALIDNNASINNPNNTDYSLNLLNDAAGVDIPFTTQQTSNGNISSVWLYSFINGVTYYDWKKLNPSSLIKPGVGYTQKGTGVAGAEQQYIFEGKPNNGTILIDAVDVGGVGSVPAETKTSYLLGNPYASALDLHKFIDDNEDVIDGTIQLWQQWSGNSHYLGQYEGGYALVNKTGSIRAYQFKGIKGANTGVLVTGAVKPSRYIAVGQGFVTEIKTGGKVEFNNSQRVFIKEADADGTGNSGSTFMKGNSKSEIKDIPEQTTAFEFQKIRLELNSVSGPEANRELLLGFSSETTDGYDYGYDAEKTVASKDDLQLNLDGKDMSIQAYSEITADKVIGLNFKSSGSHTFEIKIADTENIAEDQAIYLKDNLTGEYFDLTQNTAYGFASEEGKFNERFEIVFKGEYEEVVTEEEEVVEENYYMYYKNTTNTLFVKLLNNNVSKLSLINMRGQVVLELAEVKKERLADGLQFNNVSSGTYVVWMRTDTNEVITKKIIVK